MHFTNHTNELWKDPFYWNKEALDFESPLRSSAWRSSLLKSAGAWKQLNKRAFTAPQQARVRKLLTSLTLTRLQTYYQTIHRSVEK